jgi:hypothetical protein
MKDIYLQMVTIVAFFLFINQSIKAQEFNNLDKSPHDIAYYRENKITPPVIKVLYGRPQKNGREIFGSLVPYGKIWRVGANEATEIRFYQDVIFGEIKVKAGTYALYAIPGETEWTLILNSNIDTWGIKNYEEKLDIARAKAKVSKAEFVETFSIGFKNKGKRVNMVLAWDTSRISVPIKL